MRFSTAWKASTKARKQRLYRYNAPLHVKQKFMSAHLNKELRTRHKTRSKQVRKGDMVKVMRGQFRGRTGKIERVDLRLGRVFIQGVEVQKRDGSKAFYPLQPSNLIVTEVYTEDKRRFKSRRTKG
ncbi:50S ribosomal protein L24 [Candidatus Woesearchaeota archaeon]|nr:50S ribosomal protein L24 [Candidatus Woesearchaeota archaeon]